jgi:hypothetical protein
MSFGVSFLRFPDLFPGRRSGEPWGDRSLVLDVAGGPYLFLGLSPEQEAAVRGKFGGLCRDGGDAPATVTTRVFRAPAADFLEIDTRGWEYTLDMEHEPASVRLAGLRLMARLDWTPALSGGLWTPEAAGEEWTSVFENYLRVLTAYRLLEEGGAVLHSAGVTDGEGAWLLLGPSGAGKTTSSRLCLSRGASVLSDDLNAVRLGEDGARLAQLPFTGDLGDRSGVQALLPLRALLRLVQGRENAARPLTPAAALAALVAAAPFVNRDPWRREALLAVLERLARSVSAWELTFTLEGDVWAILKTLPP